MPGQRYKSELDEFKGPQGIMTPDEFRAWRQRRSDVSGRGIAALMNVAKGISGLGG